MVIIYKRTIGLSLAMVIFRLFLCFFLLYHAIGRDMVFLV